MDTYFQNGLSPGDAPVPWQLALIEDPNRLACEVRQALMQDSAGILPDLAAQLELQNVCLQEAVRFPQRKQYFSRCNISTQTRGKILADQILPLTGKSAGTIQLIIH